MELCSDFTFRQKAEKIKKQMSVYDPDSGEFQTAKNLFDAHIHDIRQEVLRP